MSAWIDRLSSLPALPLRHGLAMALAMAAAFAVVPLLTPELQAVTGSPQLEASVPAAFGDWTRVDIPQGAVDVVANDGRGTLRQPYDEVLMRTYRNAKGDEVMLALAYGREQRQDIKVHRPELCYAAAGFRVVSTQDTVFGNVSDADTAVRGKRLYAESRRGNEAVSYWIRIGDVYTDSGWDARRHIVAQGLQGKIPDGMLVRVSRRVDNLREAEAAWPQQDDFLDALIESLPEQTRGFLVR